MKLGKLSHFLQSSFGTLALLLASIAMGVSQPVKADVRTPCVSSISDSDLENTTTCTTAATTYGLTLYQVGVCTANPMSAASGLPDTSSCEMVIENQSGQYVDLGQLSANSKVFLNNISGVTRPKNGTYNYVYVRFGKTVVIKGVATIQAGTVYTSSSGVTGAGSYGSTNIADYGAYSDTLTKFGSSCVETNDYGGKGALIDSSLQPISFDGTQCPLAAYIAVSASATSLFGSPLTINENTKGIDLKFTTSSDAIGLYRNGGRYLFGFLGFKLSLAFL